MTSTEALDRRLANLQDHAHGEPYTGAVRTFLCGHPKTDANSYLKRGKNGTCYQRCRECARAYDRKYHADGYQPVTCPACGARGPTVTFRWWLHGLTGPDR